MNYHECRKFGQENCCRTIFEKFVEHVETVQVVLIFLDATQITINPWVVSPETEYPDYWTALRMQNPEYEAIDSTKLTQKSRLLYAKHHHTGIIKTPKSLNCPFRT